MKKRKHSVKEQKNSIQGVLSITKKGFGFVDVSAKNGIFVAKKHMNGAFHGDLVEARLKTYRGKRECEITKIVQRGLSTVTGIIKKEGNRYYLVPYHEKLPMNFSVKKSHLNGGKEGNLAVGEIIHYDNDAPAVYLTEILGNPEKSGNDMTLVLRKYSIQEEFPYDVLSQELPSVTEEELQNRTDYTKKTVITIDGDDAKDLDDAISVEKIGDHYLLGVHIADVSYYVRGRTPIDMEAYARGTSVYLPDRAVPMLPEKLSNGLCSLNPDERKLTFSCVMEIDSNGELVSYSLEKSYIQSKMRTSYSKVKAFLSGEKVTEYEGIRDTLELSYELYQILKKKRKREGYVEFSFPETAFQLGEDGVPKWVGPYEISFANEMIEEFMLLANVAVANYAIEENLPFVYRVHQKPEVEKIEQLYTVLKLFGLKIPKNTLPNPKELNAILSEAKGSEWETVVHQLALRSMKKAVYSSVCSGHYGLNFTRYCHFTSPIRRYPDLLIHRILSEHLLGKSVKKYQKFVESAAEHSSYMEENAFYAERLADDVKKALYMKDRIGEVFDGYISGICDTGFFVMLPNTVEGYVPMISLTEDDYLYQEELLRFFGRNTKKTFQMGQSVSVCVKAADTTSGKIEFELS